MLFFQEIHMESLQYTSCRYNNKLILSTAIVPPMLRKTYFSAKKTQNKQDKMLRTLKTSQVWSVKQIILGTRSKNLLTKLIERAMDSIWMDCV